MHFFNRLLWGVMPQSSLGTDLVRRRGSPNTTLGNPEAALTRGRGLRGV